MFQHEFKRQFGEAFLVEADIPSDTAVDKAGAPVGPEANLAKTDSDQRLLDALHMQQMELPRAGPTEDPSCHTRTLEQSAANASESASWFPAAGAGRSTASPQGSGRRCFHTERCGQFLASIRQEVGFLGSGEVTHLAALCMASLTFVLSAKKS